MSSEWNSRQRDTDYGEEPEAEIITDGNSDHNTAGAGESDTPAVGDSRQASANLKGNLDHDTEARDEGTKERTVEKLKKLFAEYENNSYHDREYDKYGRQLPHETRVYETIPRPEYASISIMSKYGGITLEISRALRDDVEAKRNQLTGDDYAKDCGQATELMERLTHPNNGKNVFHDENNNSILENSEAGQKILAITAGLGYPQDRTSEHGFEILAQEAIFQWEHGTEGSCSSPQLEHRKQLALDLIEGIQNVAELNEQQQFTMIHMAQEVVDTIDRLQEVLEHGERVEDNEDEETAYYLLSELRANDPRPHYLQSVVGAQQFLVNTVHGTPNYHVSPANAEFKRKQDAERRAWDD